MIDIVGLSAVMLLFTCFYYLVGLRNKRRLTQTAFTLYEFWLFGSYIVLAVIFSSAVAAYFKVDLFFAAVAGAVSGSVTCLIIASLWARSVAR